MRLAIETLRQQHVEAVECGDAEYEGGRQTKGLLLARLEQKRISPISREK